MCRHTGLFQFFLLCSFCFFPYVVVHAGEGHGAYSVARIEGSATGQETILLVQSGNQYGEQDPVDIQENEYPSNVPSTGMGSDGSYGEGGYSDDQDGAFGDDDLNMRESDPGNGEMLSDGLPDDDGINPDDGSGGYGDTPVPSNGEQYEGQETIPDDGGGMPNDQIATDNSAGGEVEQELKPLYEKGQAAYLNAQFHDALDAFFSVKEQSRSPRVNQMMLWNIAKCYNHLKKPLYEAVYLERYLETQPPKKDGQEAQQRLKAISH